MENEIEKFKTRDSITFKMQSHQERVDNNFQNEI